MTTILGNNRGEKQEAKNAEKVECLSNVNSKLVRVKHTQRVIESSFCTSQHQASV